MTCFRVRDWVTRLIRGAGQEEIGKVVVADMEGFVLKYDPELYDIIQVA